MLFTILNVCAILWCNFLEINKKKEFKKIPNCLKQKIDLTQCIVGRFQVYVDRPTVRHQ